MDCISPLTETENLLLSQRKVHSIQRDQLIHVEYLFFGKVTATLEAAMGPGIVSAFILQSDDLDEIDWEWLGGATTYVQSNYFSKGDTSSYDRGGTHAVSNPQSSFHSMFPASES